MLDELGQLVKDVRAIFKGHPVLSGIAIVWSAISIGAIVGGCIVLAIQSGEGFFTQ